MGAPKSEAHRAALKAAWTRPERRAVNARPEVREKHRVAMLAAWTRPEVQEKHRAARDRPEYQEKMRAANARPEIREQRRIVRMRPDVQAKHRAAMARPETRQKLSVAGRAAMARPETKERHRAGLEAWMSRPDAWWTLDHNHQSHYVRGVLCRECNRGIFRENPEVLQSAAVYFARPLLDIVYPIARKRRALRTRLLAEQNGRCAICQTDNPRPLNQRTCAPSPATKTA